MNSLRELLEEYDRLGEAGFSSPHDFTLRQRKLETWAAKAREALADLAKSRAAGQDEGAAIGDLESGWERS